MHTIRPALVTAWTSVFLFACDLPPETPFGETDSETPQETDSDIEWETDSQDETGKTCVQAVLCIVLNPEETLTCFSGLDDDDRTAALGLSVCAATVCADFVDNLLNFGLCLVQDCGPESIDCVQTSIAGAVL